MLGWLWAVLAGCCAPTAVSSIVPGPSGPERHDVRELADHLGETVTEVAWESRDQGRPRVGPEFRACTDAEAAAAAATHGPLHGCAAAGEAPGTLIETEIGDAQDCPSGCFWAHAVGVYDGARYTAATGSAADWLHRTADEVLRSLYAPPHRPGDRFDRYAVTCAERRGFAAEVSAPDRLAVMRFDGDDGCVLLEREILRSRVIGEEEPTVGLTVDLGLSGALWLRADGTLDASGLTAKHARIQATLWTDVEMDRAGRGATVTRREVLADSEADRPALAPCPVDPAVAQRVTDSVFDACGNPTKEMAPALLMAVLEPGGGFSGVAVRGSQPVDPAWPGCVDRTMAALREPATGCPAMPVLAHAWSFPHRRR